MDKKIASSVRFSLILLLGLFFPLLGQATHIVGGEMTYTCLGPNEDGINVFEIRLTVFRDCENGVPPFDAIADIGIYDQDSILIDSLFIPIDPMVDDTIDAVISNPCLVVPPNVCVHTTTYVARKALPFRPGGYRLAYQRCCRNFTIVNIVRPLSTGATFDVVISDLALSECNSSAKFVAWPPIYICANEPIDFDHSAIDQDGDSIVYKLCTPITGGDSTMQLAMPSPGEQTIPRPVVWVAPPYGVNNMLNTLASPVEDRLMIDSETGFLTGIPDIEGQFVVGICIEEYRDGLLISETRRDFQYNVGICGEAISSFFLPEILCDGLTVDFDNSSINADEYLWMFNDPNNPGATSTLAEPSFTFSDTGTYEIVLIAEPGNQCVDTSIQVVNLQLPSLDANFQIIPTDCSDTYTVSILDLSVDTISTIVFWKWTLRKGTEVLDTSRLQNPSFTVSTPGQHNIDLIVRAANGCEQELSFSFPSRVIPVVPINDTIPICNGDSVLLLENPSQGYNYEWSPAAGLSDPTAANPLASPSQTTTYTVLIYDNARFCELEHMITVVIPDPIQIDMPEDTLVCENEFAITAFSPQAGLYTWSEGSSNGTIISNDSSAVLAINGDGTFFLKVEDDFGCIAFDSIFIEERAVDVELQDTLVICQDEAIQLGLTNLNQEDTLNYNWMPIANIISGAMTDTPLVSFTMPGAYQLTVLSENQFNCSTLDSLTVNVLDTASQLDFVASNQCGGFTVQFSNTSFNAPYYNWNFGDPNDPGANSNAINPVYTYPDTGTYEVTLTYNIDVDCPDTIVKTIRVDEPEIVVDFDWEYEECGDSVVIAFTDQSTNSQSTIQAWQWTFSNGASSSQQDTSLLILESELLNANLLIRSDDGCIDTLSQLIPIELISVNLPDSLAICPGEARQLNPDPDTTYNYLWSPATGLDDPTSPNPLASPNVPTTYSVTITDLIPDTCEIVRTIYTFVAPELTLSVPEGDTTCETSYLLTASTNNEATFEWSEDPLFSPGTIIGTTAEVEVSPSGDVIYFVRATDEFGCSVVDEVPITGRGINAEPINYLLCLGDSVEIEVAGLFPGDIHTFSWTPVDEIWEGADTESPLVGPTMTTIYSAAISNQYGCSTTVNTLVQVIPDQPLLSVSPIIDTIIDGESVQITATEDTSYTYSWTPIIGLSDPSISNPIASPTETTTYTLTVTNRLGCQNVARVTIVVVSSICDDPYIFVPNAFSPNGDGENETFKVLGFNIDEIYLAVYNRWGQRIFETRSKDVGWDGTFEGKALPPDVFGYYVRLRCITGEEFFRKGNVTLLR